MDLTRHGPADHELPEILTLIQDSFAYMEGIIDPPSSMHSLTVQMLQAQTKAGELWSLGPPLSACVFLTPHPNTLYIGKLCVAPKARRQGLAKHLITLATQRAKAQNLNRLELQSRIELSENHATFRAMGFIETGQTTHSGYKTPTSITFTKTA